MPSLSPSRHSRALASSPFLRPRPNKPLRSKQHKRSLYEGERERVMDGKRWILPVSEYSFFSSCPPLLALVTSSTVPHQLSLEENTHIQEQVFIILKMYLFICIYEVQLKYFTFNFKAKFVFVFWSKILVLVISYVVIYFVEMNSPQAKCYRINLS